MQSTKEVALEELGVRKVKVVLEDFPRAPTLLPGSWGRCGRRKENGFLAVLFSHMHFKKTFSLAQPSPGPLRHTPILGELWALCPLGKF